jgi:ATP-dependent Clp protease adaptor protein ClpS
MTTILPETTNTTSLMPNYAVILHNDDDHTLTFVIEMISKVCKYGSSKCMALAMRVHYEGRAHVWIGPLEIAELKCEQLTNCGKDPYSDKHVDKPLNVTVEPLP